MVDRMGKKVGFQISYFLLGLKAMVDSFNSDTRDDTVLDSTLASRRTNSSHHIYVTTTLIPNFLRGLICLEEMHE